MVLEAYTSPNSSFSREYIGNKVYENGVLKRILLPNGYISNGNYYFYLRDHLGNNVVTASYDFHARTLEEYGSFTTMDPLAEKYYSISPYAYCAVNPIRFIDPTGMIWEDPKQADRLNKSINNRIESIDKNSTKIQAQINKGGLSDKKLAKLENRLAENSQKVEMLNQSLADVEAIGNAAETYKLT